MTTETTAQHEGVIDHCMRLFPASDPMAAFTDVGALNMLGRFAKGGHPIVAGGAISAYPIVIIAARTPGDGIVTILAGAAVDWNMGR